LRLAARSSFFDTRTGVCGYQAVIDRLVQGRREYALHHPHGVRVQSPLKLARLEGPHVDNGDFPEPEAFEKGQEVVANGPLVAAVGAGGYLVASRIRKPAFQVLGDRKTLGIGEERTLALVGEGSELRIVRHLSGTAVEAYLPTARRCVEGGAGLVASVLAAAGVGSCTVRVLFTPCHIGYGSVWVRPMLLPFVPRSSYVECSG
jgi:hypothetical protein